MTGSPTIDCERFGFEVKRALDRAGVLVELLDPRDVDFRHRDGFIEVMVRGDIAARFHESRLYAVERAAVVRAVRRMLAESFDVATGDQIAAAFAEGKGSFHDLVDVDWVLVELDGRPVARVHRSEIVPGWCA